MKSFKSLTLKEKMEYIGILAIYPLILLYEQIGKSVKFLNSRSKQITASILTVCLMLTMIPLSAITVFAADTRPPHNHCSCGLDTDVCDTEYEDHHKDYLFPIWEPDTRMPIGKELEPISSGGSNPSPKVYYYLVHDVDMSDKWEIQNEGKTCNITICLYDHTITNTKSGEDTPVIDIWRGGRLYLTTCGRRSMDGDAEITHTGGALGSGVWVGGQQEITSRNKGYFYFYGGNIVRNTSTTNGGGVWVLPDGKFEMYRGSISGNTSFGNGGGVYNTGKFDMYGGEISDNDAMDQGDGVYNTGEFNMTGGTISSTGVAIENTGTMTISGGTVSGSRGIRNVDNGTVKLSGNPEISSNLGTVDIECYSTNEGQIDADGYTGKPLKVAIGGSTAGQDNFDLMLNKVIVKNATADKFILVDSMGNTYTDYALVQEGSDLVLHQHTYTYSVSDNIIKETCICAHEKKATLSAPTGELVYNGNSFNASITYDEGWIGEKPTEISYTKNTVATSDTTGAGNYIASVTIENKTVSVAYKIEKATPTDVSWPTGLKGIAGNPLNTITLPDGFTWITPNRVMDYNMRDADIRYQPNANYNPVENSVSIEVDDDKDPTGTISIGDKTWSSFVEKENITFNTFFSEKQTVTITVDDGKYGSGVDYDELGYYISTKKKSISELSNMTYDTWKEYTGAFEIKPNGEYIIYVRFQDYANNMTYLSSDGIVLDSIAPTVSGIENGKIYCGAVEVTVSDTYLDKVEIGGVKATVTDGKFTVSPASGAQEIIAFDKAGNTTTYTITVNNGHICTYDESTEDTIVEKCQYCDFSASAQIKAPTGELVYNGNANDASIVYTGTLSGGNNLVISYGDATDTINAGKYTATITFGGKTAKVNYEVKKADYTNITWPTKLSGNVGDKVSSIVLENGFVWNNPNEIIDYEKKDYAIRYELDRKNYNSVTQLISVKAIDDVAPTGEISIGTNRWNTFLNTITFGLFFKETQTVTITTNDNEYGSGVDEVYYYLATEEKSVNELTNMALSSWKEYKDAFNINPNRKYIIYVRILDEATNETFISSEGIVIDNEAPVISGITDGATYCGDVEATVTDAYLDKVTVGGIETTVTDGKFTVGHASETQEIKAYDKAGNVTTYTITFDNNHTYSYDESTADTIVEKCQRCNHSASAQIKKPTGELVYNGSAHNATVVYTGTLSGGNNLSISYGTATDTIGAGDYTASITLGGKTASVSYTVEKQKVTPPTIDGKVYTGETQTADITDTERYTVTTNAGGKNVAAYDVVLTLKDGNNYKWDASTGVDGNKITLKFQISRVANEWTENPAIVGWTYGGTVKAPTGTAKFVEGNYGIAYYDKDKNPIGNPSDAGEYYAEIFVTSTDNFTGLSSGYLSFTIEKADLTITAKGHSITYGDAPSNNGVEYSGFVNNEEANVLGGTLAFEYSYAQYDDIEDNFTITPKGLTAANYEITFVPGKLTVNPLEAEIEWSTLSESDLVYDGNTNTLTATVSNKKNNDAVSFEIDLTGDNINVTADGFYYTVTGLTGDKAGNYKLGSALQSPTYKITKATPNIGEVTVSGPEHIYFNTETYSIVLDRTDASVAGVLKLTAGQTLTVGTRDYDWTFTPNDTINYNNATGKVSVTVEKIKLDVSGISWDLLGCPFTYDGTKKSVTLVGTLPTGVVADKSGNAATNAGSYTATATFKLAEGYDNGVYEIVGATDNKVSANWAINPKTVTPIIEVTDGSIYDGTEKKPTVKVYDGDIEIPASEYTLGYTNNINAGNATVAVTDQDGGNYIVNGTRNFTIGNATFTTDVEQDGSLTYNSTEQSAAVKATESGVKGSQTVTYKYGLTENTCDSTTVPAFKDAGKYTVYFVATANNHNDVKGSFEVKIAPKVLKIEDFAQSSPQIQKVYDGTTAVPSVRDISVYAINGLQGSDASPDITVLSAVFDNVNAGDRILNISIEGNDTGNYVWDAGIVKSAAVINPKTVASLVIVLSKDSFDYTGSSFEPVVTVKDGDTEIPASEYIIAYTDNINAGTATVTVIDKVGGNYTVNGTKNFVINKAAYPVVWPENLAGNQGDKLSNIELSEGFEWDNPDEIIKYNYNAYAMTYTPADTANYNVAHKDIAVIGADVTAPMGEITLKDNKWTEFWNNLTFGLFFKDTQSITITAADTESGVKEIAYHLSAEELSKEDVKALESSKWTVYTDAFNVEPDNKYVVYARITDNAGNVIYINSDGIVLDSIKPVISGVEDGKDVYGDATFTVDEGNLDTVTLDGEPIEVKDGKYSVPADNKEHTIVVTDKTGNQVTYKLTVFKNYKVSFVVDGKETLTSEVGYGNDTNLPEIPAKDGYTAKWDVDGKNITADTVITAVYEKISESPKTGDNTNIWLWVAVMFVSGLSLFGFVVTKKRKEQEAE